MSISLINLDEGVSSKFLSKDSIGLDPFKQFPAKFSSSLSALVRHSSKSHVVCTIKLAHTTIENDTILQV